MFYSENHLGYDRSIQDFRTLRRLPETNWEALASLDSRGCSCPSPFFLAMENITYSTPVQDPILRAEKKKIQNWVGHKLQAGSTGDCFSLYRPTPLCVENEYRTDSPSTIGTCYQRLRIIGSNSHAKSYCRSFGHMTVTLFALLEFSMAG